MPGFLLAWVLGGREPDTVSGLELLVWDFSTAVSHPSLAVSSGKMAYSLGPALELEGPDLRPAESAG